ncbi:MAG: response regulator [Planctomycetes bacterium]|nr:response regulator [Planctomycetota bacterium]
MLSPIPFSDFLMEALRGVLLAMLMVYFWYVGKRERLGNQVGWKFILAGLAILVLAVAVDVADDVHQWRAIILFGEVSLGLVVEEIFGYALGLTLFMIGVIKWISLVASHNRMKEQIEKTNISLQAEIEERKQLQAQLIHSEQLAAVGTLAGGVAHEFNNINTSVLGYSELGLNGNVRPEETELYLNKIRAAALRARDITNNLLTFAGKSSGRRMPRSLVDIAEDTLALVEGQFRTEGVVFRKKMSPLPNSMMEGSQIGQIVLNFLINANHALIGREKRIITLESGVNGEAEIWLKVSDTGCGIPKENLSKIFTPFFSTKGEHAEKNSPQVAVRGTGIGLSVCHSIAENHGGRIEVESEPGLGSSFTLVLPLQEGRGHETPLDGKEPVASVFDGKVLILDDEPDVREVVSLAVQSAGGEAVACADANEALSLVAQNDVDVVLVDLQMPMIPGAEFIRKMQELKLENPPACIVLTGKVRSSLDVELAGLEVDCIISKPFEISDFCFAIAGALAGRK